MLLFENILVEGKFSTGKQGGFPLKQSRNQGMDTGDDETYLEKEEVPSYGGLGKKAEK